MPAVSFSHPVVGGLTIDNGIDDAQWSYNLNTATFPTYGGEVVQVLSVYIDDLTLYGTCSTYRQIEAIYSFFAQYLQVATQGKNPTPLQDTTTGSAYNLQPVTFSYPQRSWYFLIYPKTVPGFQYGYDVVAPTWQMSAHVIDNSPDLDLIKDGLKALAVNKLADGSVLSINGEISPSQGNPDTDPFQTYTSGIAAQQQIISKYSDYYNSLLPAYAQGDFSAITGGLGATPAFGVTADGQNPGTSKIPSAPTSAKTGPNTRDAVDKLKQLQLSQQGTA